MFNLIRIPEFERDLKKLSKKFEKSKKSIEKEINKLAKKPFVGNIQPGLPPETRKLRLPLKEYKMGQSGGLRLYFFIHKEKKNIYLLFLYKKGVYSSEREILSEIKSRIKGLIKSLDNQQPNEQSSSV